MCDVTIRSATERDVPIILNFIKELAEYEHMADEAMDEWTVYRISGKTLENNN